MKKTLIIILIAVLLIAGLFILTGCNNKEEENSEKIISGGWKTVLTDKELAMSEEAKNAFEKATKDYTSLKLDLVALLGEQVVAGKNYMYLAKGYKTGEEASATYKIVIVYNDLTGAASVTHVNDFDYTKYVSKNIESDNERLSGGWSVNSSEETGVLDEKAQNVFNSATSTLTGMSYRPIAVLGTQLVAGTNYAVLCYGSASYENMPESIYLITIYEDLQGSTEITSHAYVDLSEFNK